MPEVKSEILEKIKTMVNYRNSLQNSDATVCQEQVNNVTAHITRMLLKHNLEMSDVHNYSIKDKDILTIRLDLNQYQTYHEGNFASILLKIIADYNFCKCIRILGDPAKCIKHRHEDQGYCTLVGRKENLEVTKYLLDFCVNNVKVMFEKHWRTYKGPDGKWKHARAFYQGARIVLVQKLEAERKEAFKENPTGMLSLIKVEDTAVSNKVKEMFPDLETVPNRTYTSKEAIIAGYNAAQKLNLSKGLEY